MSSGRSPGTTGFKSAMSGSFLALACTPWSRRRERCGQVIALDSTELAQL